MCCGDEGDGEGQDVGDGISLHEVDWEYSHEGVDGAHEGFDFEVHEGFDVQVHEGFDVEDHEEVDGAHEGFDV